MLLAPTGSLLALQKVQAEKFHCYPEPESKLGIYGSASQFSESPKHTYTPQIYVQKGQASLKNIKQIQIKMPVLPIHPLDLFIWEINLLATKNCSLDSAPKEKSVFLPEDTSVIDIAH